MKNATTYLHPVLLSSALVFLPLWSSVAADSSSNASDGTASQAAAAVPPVVSRAPAPLKLPYGVNDVLKLSRAQIGEQIILNYIQNSGTIYNLGATELVYLKAQGVSDNVLRAMLAQRSRVELAAQSAQAQAAATAPNGLPSTADSEAPVAPSYPEPNAAYDQTPPTPPTAGSTTYVIPYSPATYPYYYPSYGYSYPYADWGPYYGGSWGPSVAFGFGFGRGGVRAGHGFFAGRGGFGGGFHGGGGGGFHGGGGGGFHGGGGGGFHGGGGGGFHGGGGGGGFHGGGGGGHGR